MGARLVQWTLAAVLLVPSAVLGAPKEPGDTTLASEGAATLRPRPTALRVQVELRAYGSSVKVALERLAGRRQRAFQKLEKLGAEKGRIVLGSPEVVQLTPLDASPAGPRVARVRRASLAMAPQATARAAAGRPWTRTRLVAEPKRAEGRLFGAARRLTADWPLADTDLDRLLVAAQELREKIEAADVGGAAEAQDLTPAERELLNEVRRQQPEPDAAAPHGASLVDEPPGPDFLYVARISPQQRKQLQSEAFGKAKSRAASLAEVAGVRLGRLYDLLCQFEAATPADSYDYAESDYPAEAPTGRLALLAVSAGDETTGRGLRSLRFTVLVTATFRLE